MGVDLDKKKQEIQVQYSQAVGELGHQVYRLFVPYLEILDKMKAVMGLNQQMAALLKEEAELAKAPKLEPVQSA